MKQKIVIKIAVDSNKSRSKALKVAAVAPGVSSVALEGKDKDEVVVIGDEVDSVCLAKLLRKKFGQARILKVEEVKKEKKEEEKKIFYYYPPCPPSYVTYDPYPANSCAIM